MGEEKAQVKAEEKALKADEPADDQRCTELRPQINELKYKLLRYDTVFLREPNRKVGELLDERNAIAEKLENLKEEYNIIANKHHWGKVD